MIARQSIGQRLRRVNRSALLIAMGLLALGMIATSLTLNLMNLVDASRAQARVLGENLGAALLFVDRKAAEDVLQSLQLAPAIRAASLHDQEGNDFVSWHRGAPAARSPVRQRAASRDPLTIELSESIHAGGTLVGRLDLRVDLTPLLLRTVLLASITLITLLLALLVSERWVRRLNATLLHPLQRLSALMERVSAGSGYDARAEQCEIAELHELGQGFNAMLTAIGDRDERLAEQHEHLARLAFSDGLTGLANRESFQETLALEIERAGRAGEPLALLFLDLDGFKDINDSLGHMTGDRLLCAASQRLRAIAPYLARLGGDEFIALMKNPDRDAAMATAASIAAEIRRPFQIDGRELRVTASIGIACFPQDGADVATLLQHADTAMYHAKAQGRDNAQFYHSSLTERAIERMTLERDLRVALEQSQFNVVYQPQFDTRTGRVDSVEALIRWTHPERGPISPADFIPVAERNGLIVPIGEYVLRTACQHAAAWRRLGLNLRVAVNLSPVQLHHPRLGAMVAECLRESALPADQLELEMTETALMVHNASTRETLQGLRELGVRLALDDFGTGFSSMSQLQRMPLNTIKIDRSFVQHLPQDRDSVTLVRTIVMMARGLGLEVTAEGVETAEQALLLTEMRCDQLQGWYVGKPVSAKEVQTWRNGRRSESDAGAAVALLGRRRV